MTTYNKGGTKITYDTTRKPGYTKMVATWDNPSKAKAAQERTAAKGRREESKKRKTEAKRIKKLKRKRSK